MEFLADISVRGGSFDQTAILLNGVNLSNPQTGHYSFDIPINLNDIERVEIMHGPSSFIYGASAFSGGINIITKKNTENEKAYIKLQAGMHNLFAAESGVNIKKGITNNHFSAGYKVSDGYIDNSDYKIFNSLWQTRLNIQESIVDIQLGYNDKRYGANTFYSPLYPNQYDKTNSSFVSVKGEIGSKLKFTPLIYWNRHNDCFQLFRDGTSNIPSWYTDHNYHQTNVYGANLNLQYKSQLGISSLGAELRNEDIISSVLGKPMNNPDGRYTKSDNRTNTSYTIEHTIVMRKMTASAGALVNYNTAQAKDIQFYPSLNVAYNLFDNLKTYASWSKATRMPTFTDMYYNTKTHEGNSGLKPEYSESFEMGLKYNKPYLNAYITTYWMKGDNLIDWIQETPTSKWKSVNSASLDKQGIEIGAKVNLHYILGTLSPVSTLKIGYTRLHQSGNNLSGEVNSNYVQNYLRDKFVAQLNLPIYKDKLSVSANFRWQKRMGYFVDYPTTILTPFFAFSTLDVGLNYKLIEKMNITINMNNLYNTHYFDLGNIPQAGFWLIGGFAYSL